MSKPLVSVCCATYNHDKYIRECLDGFVNQKTDFDFEVLIHDDASTDTTAAIIREYEREFPNIIKPIYQTENQYSKGIAVTRVFNYSRSQGKYIAMCEGDDYWTDPLKLQKQVDFMEQHSDFGGCFHPTLQLCAQTEVKTIFSIENELISTRDLILFKGGGMIDTCALLYRKEALMRASRWYEFMPIDQTLNLQISLNGPIGKVNSVMAVYRINQATSWSGIQGKDYKKRIAFSLQELKMWRLFYRSEAVHFRGAVSIAAMKIMWLWLYNWLLFGCEKLFGPVRFEQMKNSLRR